MSNIIDRILAEACLDSRIPDGIFDMSNNAHMDVLRENMTDKFNVSLNDVKDIHNKMLEGKYPERQAYNKDGLLVTFPTPQHKAKAISRGTHFEQDPSKGNPNVFAGGTPPTAGGTPPAAPAGGAPEAPSQNVFGASPAAPAPEKPAAPPAAAPPPAAPAGGQSTPSALPKSDTPPPAPAAPSAPASAGGGSPSSLPSSDPQQKTQSAASGTQGLEIEPLTPTQPGKPESPLPPPNFDNPKPPEQRAAEAQVVKQMMSGDPNNPTLSPTMPVNVNELLSIAKRMGYAAAMQVILEAMNRK